MKIMPFDRIDFYVLCCKNVASQNPSFHGDIDMKKIIFSIFLLILVAGVSGCMKPSPKEEMMKYMQDKYHEEFEFVSINTQVWSADYVEMKLRSKKFPDDTITVRMVKESSVISDDYTDFLMKKPIEDEFNHNILPQVYKNSRAFYLPGGMPLPYKDLQKMSISEYSKVKVPPMSLLICISDNNIEDKDKLIEKLRELLAGKKYKFELYVFYMLDGKLSEINDSNINEIFTGATETKWAKIRGHFMMNDNFEFHSSRWRELK
jgi:hypothetical protein